MPEKLNQYSVRDIQLNPINFISRIVQSNNNNDYEIIKENNNPVDNLEINNNGIINEQKLKISYYQNISIVGILIASFLLTISYLSYGNNDVKMSNLSQSLTRAIAFRQIVHVEPPTSYWGSVIKPYPTGAFWTNLAVKNGDGAVGIYPYGVKTVDAGIQVSYGASRRAVSPIAITDPFVTDLQIGSLQGFVSRGIESYDNTSVTVCYKTQVNGKFRTYLVKGSPFITVVYENATPVITSSLMRIISVDSRIVKGSIGVQYIVTLGNFQKWLVYCSEPVALLWKENTLTSPNPIRGFIRVSILPVQNAENAFNMLLGYVQKYATGAVMALAYPSGTTATVNWQYTVVGNGQLLMLALPHHIPLMTYPLDNDESKSVQAAFSPIWSIKGKLKVIIGEKWTLQYGIVQVGWNYALTDKLSTIQLDDIAKQLLIDVTSVIPTAVDPYTFGKQIGRMARLAQIADNLGIADARTQALQALETALTPWLLGTNENSLLYDKTYGGKFAIIVFWFLYRTLFYS